MSLQALARAVGIRQPSLYEHFDSKLGLYDAMFADGNRQLLERLDHVELPSDPRALRHLDRRVDLHPGRHTTEGEAPVNGRRISRPEARVLAEEEFRRFADLVASLSPDEWAQPTECTGWDVRKMALHILGSAEAQASVREFVRQLRRGLPLNKQIDSHHWVDGMNEQQIRDRSHLTNGDLVAALTTVGPRAVKGRWRTPPPIRFLPMPFGPPVGWKPLKYLLDVGFTRDVWAHRIDMCVAIGREMVLTPDHDGRLVADLVAEWASLHGEPFELILYGPAGGRFSQGLDGERVEMDAIDFVRTLCGRLPGTGVLAHPLPL